MVSACFTYCSKFEFGLSTEPCLELACITMFGHAILSFERNVAYRNSLRSALAAKKSVQHKSRASCTRASCTLNINMFSLQILDSTDRQQHTQSGISPYWSPCFKEINSMHLGKTLCNVSGLETFNLTLGSTLDLQNPFSCYRLMTRRNLTELKHTVFAWRSSDM